MNYSTEKPKGQSTREFLANSEQETEALSPTGPKELNFTHMHMNLEMDPSPAITWDEIAAPASPSTATLCNSKAEDSYS